VCSSDLEGKEEDIRIRNSVSHTVLKVVHFQCKCGKQWQKNKENILRAINGGFNNIYGDWIQCDSRGRIVEESVLEAIKRVGNKRGICIPDTNITKSTLQNTSLFY
jgi:hypothetical protein